jgi:hypothetical protein
MESEDVQILPTETVGTTGSYEGIVRTKDQSKSTTILEGTFQRGFVRNTHVYQIRW